MTISDVPEQHRADVEERAAILEFEAGLSRVKAEYAALLAFQREAVSRLRESIRKLKEKRDGQQSTGI